MTEMLKNSEKAQSPRIANKNEEDPFSSSN